MIKSKQLCRNEVSDSNYDFSRWFFQDWRVLQLFLPLLLSRAADGGNWANRLRQIQQQFTNRIAATIISATQSRTLMDNNNNTRGAAKSNKNCFNCYRMISQNWSIMRFVLPRKYKWTSFPSQRVDFNVHTQQVHHQSGASVSWWPAKCNRRRSPRSNIIKATVTENVHCFAKVEKMYVDATLLLDIIKCKKAQKKLLQAEKTVMCNVDQLPTICMSNWRNFANNHERD